MSELSDRELLNLIARDDAAQRRRALETLIRRELDFVYSAAIRQARFDCHLAQDITQAVFILLARKAPKLRDDVILRDWLFLTTRYAAKNALKLEARRRYHEQRAAMERDRTTEEPEPLRDQLMPLIDEAVARLNSTDRAGVLLSFFDNKTYREVGVTLGVSEEAARKRVGRAIEKMRAFFAARGVRVERAAGAIVVSSALRASAGAVPATLANSMLDVALSAPSASSTTTSYLLAKEASKMFIYAKLKLVAAAIAASVVVGGSSVVLFARVDGDVPAAPAPAATATTNASVAKFDDGMTVELAGIRNLGDDQRWWRADGSPSNESCDPLGGSNEPPHTHQLFFRIANAPADIGVSWSVAPVNNWAHDRAMSNGQPIEGGESITVPANGADRIGVTVMIASGQWESILTAEQLDGMTCGAGKQGGVIFSPTINAPNPANNNQPGALVTVSHSISAFQYRVIGVDDAGVEHVGRPGNSAAAGSVHQNLYQFDMPVENLRTVSFQVRPYDRKATFANITLDPAKKTAPTVKAERN